MTLLQPPPYLIPTVAEPPNATPPAAEVTPQPQPLADLIRAIAIAEETLAVQRNILRRRVNNEQLTATESNAIAALAKDGDARARSARKRYRSIENAIIYRFPHFLDATRRFDWRRAGDAALKLALSRSAKKMLPALDRAIDVLSVDELESYAFLRRLTGTRAAYEASQKAAA